MYEMSYFEESPRMRYRTGQQAWGQENSPQGSSSREEEVCSPRMEVGGWKSQENRESKVSEVLLS